jgi:tetratricopeptide (TPR) repeat protein
MDGTSRIDELEQKFIENPRRYFAPLANEYRKAGNPQQAIAICQAHLGQLPGHMSGQIVYGQALFEAGQFAEARTVFENALAMDRENLLALRHLGDIALREGQSPAAKQWYSKLLEIDPQDAAVIALVNEIDAASDAGAQPMPESEEQPAPEAQAPVAEAPAPAVVSAADAFHSEEEDKLMAAELGYPLPPPQAFVTETMAELYLAQGFRDRALSVYRQLVELRPHDERLRARLTELERAESPPVVARQEETPSVESPVEEPESDRVPSVETPTPTAPEVQTPSEESTDGDTFTIDLPPDETSASEPEGIAAQLTVREFFATLGRRRPSSRSNGSTPNGADANAAAALAGAFATIPAAQSSPPTQTAHTPTGAPGKESEEDVEKFRAWLDGLTGA